MSLVRNRADKPLTFCENMIEMSHVPRREFWNNANPERLADAWRLTEVKNGQTLVAVCEVWAVELGWELRLFVEGSMIQCSLARSGREMVDRAEEWRVAMTEKGWR